MKKMISGLLILVCSGRFLYSAAADELLNEAIEQADVKKAKQALSNGADIYAHEAHEQSCFEWIISRRIGGNSQEIHNLEIIALEIVSRMTVVSIDDFNKAVGLGGSLAIVTAMKSKLNNINETDILGMTPLQATVNGYGDPDLVAYLIEHGANINQEPVVKEWGNILSLALSPGGHQKNKIIKYLLDHGAKATLENVRLAALKSEGDAAIIKKMAAQGIDINAPLPDEGGSLRTVFAWMLCTTSKPEIFNYFITNGADVNSKPDAREPYSPLDVAIKQLYYAYDGGGVDMGVVQAMLNKGARITDLTRAIAHEDVVLVNRIIQPFPDQYEVPSPADVGKRLAVLKLLAMPQGDDVSQ
jgi:hypothetical protein